MSVVSRVYGASPRWLKDLANRATRRALMARGDLAGAASLYRHAYGADPRKTAPLVGLGQVLAASGEPKDAAEAFRKALALEPQNAEALRGLGNSMVAINQPELAIGH